MNLCTECSFADPSYESADLHESWTGHTVLLDATGPSLAEPGDR